MATSDEDIPAVSVVVIGRNERERLARCLRSVCEADYGAERLELIYVDTDSTDDSCAIAEKLGARVVAIRPERPSAAAARNAGLQVASHELIQFLDGDTLLRPGWLRIAVRALDDPSIACVFGRRDEIEPHATIYNFCTHHDWFVPPGRAAYCGGDVMFRRHVLKQVGGYNASLIAGEEQDLVFRINVECGKDALSLDEGMTLHDIGMTQFKQYWRRCVRAGYAYAEVGRLHPGLAAFHHICIRNCAHGLAAILAVVLSLLTQSVWPFIAWAVLVGIAIARNGIRYHGRMDSLGAACVYSIHHYVSKMPLLVGQCNYWLRRSFGASPQRLIEYRDSHDAQDTVA